MRPGPAGSHKIVIVFELDKSGILTVHSVYEGNKTMFPIDYNNVCASVKNINDMMRDQQIFEDADEIEYQRINARKDLINHNEAIGYLPTSVIVF